MRWQNGDSQCLNYQWQRSFQMFKLSGVHPEKLEGVNPILVDTVKEAIKLSSVDFGVIYGVRSLAEQEKLYKSGRSQTMKSKHLIQDDKTSHAVDLMAYDGSNPSWDIVMYDDIADAMKAAALKLALKFVGELPGI